MNTKAETAVPSHQGQRKITFFNFPSNFWSHNAVLVGHKYLSTHTSTHFNPPTETEFRDPDDSATKILEIWRNIVQPMIFSRMVFGNMRDELTEYQHESVDVPVTEEQFQKAQELIDSQVSQAHNGLLKYSILRPFGTSCGESAQAILDEITRDTYEADLAKRSLAEWLVAWPQYAFNRAALVSASRQQPPSLAKRDLSAHSGHTDDQGQEYSENTFWRRATSFL